MGKGGSGNGDSSVNVRPVSALRDPASFGPPPKRTPNARISDGDSRMNGGDRGDEEAKLQVPPKPYTMNSTGVSTETLPLPPRRANTSPGFSEGPGKRPPPVPPRLPPRGESALPTPKAVVDMSTGGVNMAAVGRLSKAGISVPGFNMSPPTTKSPLPNDPRPSMGMSSLKNNPGTPSEGTTFAEKKAALMTANSFYKNPSSVSFSDATAALKTGRNFQQRHGDQVASGYKKAQEMGLDNKGYGDLYTPRNEAGGGGIAALRDLTRSPPLALTTKQSPSLPPRPPGMPRLPHSESDLPGKRKPPPPPPPKKKAAPPTPQKQVSITSPHHNPTRLPPVIPRATRPSLSVSSTVLRNNGLPTQIFLETQSEFDLCLSKAWFTKNPLRFPPSIEAIDGKMHSFTSSWERSPSGRTKHTLILAIRWTLNLSTTKIKITWDASAPGTTAKAEQKQFPPPASAPRPKEWGDRIVNWVRARIGQQVGNGECWTLAADCFSSLQSEDKAVGGDQIMTAQGTSFGLCIFSHYPSLHHQPTVLPGSVLQPGDILQFRSARWVRRDSNGRVIFEMRAGAAEDTAGCKDHTAVIETVQYDAEGGVKLCVLQQNSGGIRTVGRGEYTLGTGEMVEGGVRVFRAVDDGWAKLDTDW